MTKRRNSQKKRTELETIYPSTVIMDMDIRKISEIEFRIPILKSTAGFKKVLVTI